MRTEIVIVYVLVWPAVTGWGLHIFSEYATINVVPVVI